MQEQGAGRTGHEVCSVQAVVPRAGESNGLSLPMSHLRLHCRLGIELVLLRNSKCHHMAAVPLRDGAAQQVLRS